MLLDISPNHMQIVRGILCHHVPDREVWAFGSRAKWTARDNSDLDLCICGDTALGFKLLSQIKDDFSESNLPWKVDVVDWATTSVSFRKIIEEDKVVVKRCGNDQDVGMGDGWKIYRLSELARFKYGKFLAKYQLAESGFPVFSGYGVVGYLPSYQFDEQQIIIVCRGEGGTGDVKMSPPKCSITNLSIVVSPNESKVSKKFLYWALKAYDTHQLRTGSAQARIVMGSLEQLRLTIPEDKRKQDCIANILSSLDDRITLLRETNATLEAIAQALFKSWFVDFDPVHAKQQGLAPEGMDEATAALFPDSFESSELGLVPKGWKVKSLNQLCNISSGKRPLERSDTETIIAKIPLYGGAGIMGYTNTSLFDVQKIVTGRVGTLGKIHIAQPPFWASDNVLVISPTRSKDFYFCFNWVKGIDIHVLNRGSTQPLLTQKDLGNQQGIVPPDSLLDLFSTVIHPVYQATFQNIEQAQTLANLRDTLLPRLISGQLRLPEAEVS
ncbi:MAG: restriction endonuclease subunit S [Magnetococcus sp. YQC-5]